MKLDLNQITIQVSSVEVSIAFYEKLGLRLIVKSLPDYARFECVGGDTTFSLHRKETDLPVASTWIYFESDTLDEDVRQLEDSGLVFGEQPGDKLWLWREARLHDPDGNTIILYHAGENRKNPPWRVN